MWKWQGQPVQAVLLDVDGTLYHQSQVRRAMLLKLVRAYCFRPHAGLRTARFLSAFRKAQENLRGSAHLPLDLAAAQLEQAAGGRYDPAYQQLIERWMEREPLAAIARHARAGLIEFCKSARGAGVRIGVFSDYPAGPKLAALGVTDYLDVVVSAQDPEVRRFKPDPTGLHVTLNRMRVDAAHAIYVGDRADVDAPAAAAAGMRCFLFAQQPAQDRSWTPISDFLTLAQMLQDNSA
jgi:putative hydrolase of the HAD superfamily